MRFRMPRPLSRAAVVATLAKAEQVLRAYGNQPVIDLYSGWQNTVRRAERLEQKVFEKLLASAVKYLKSRGLDLDVSKSWLGKEWHGSDGWRIQGVLTVVEREENSSRRSSNGRDESRDPNKVLEDVKDATGVGVRAKLIAPWTYAVELGE